MQMDEKRRVHFLGLFLACFVILVAINTSCFESKDWYVSQLIGQESSSCDSPQRPCKSLGDVLPLIAWGDRIYFDGANTDKKPYTCVSTTSEHPGTGIRINMSLSLIGYNASVFIKCPSGIFFTGEQTEVALYGLDFLSTPLSFHHCSVSINSTFFGVSAEGNESRYAETNDEQLKFHSTRNVSIVDSEFNESKMSVNGSESISLENSRFHSNTGRALSIVLFTGGTVNVNNCMFINNWGGLKVANMAAVSISITNSLFYGNAEGSALTLELSRFSIAVIRNITVQNNNLLRVAYIRGAPVYIACERPENNSVLISQSVFKHNSNPKTGAGAIMIDNTADLITSQGCRKIFDHSIDAYPTFLYTNEVVFEETLFEENIGQYTGALFASNGLTVLKNCTFHNNFAEFRSSHVSVTGVTGGLEIQNSTFRQSQWNAVVVDGKNFTFTSFLYTSSPGRLILKNTLMDVLPFGSPTLVEIVNGGYVRFDNSSSAVCPVGSQVYFDNYSHAVEIREPTSMENDCGLDIKVYSIHCLSCPHGFYSLQRGHLNGTTVDKNFQCLPCPFGGNCSRNIVSQTHFWAALEKLHPPTLKFYVCPFGYCSPPQHSHSEPSVYNGCQGNRSGILCGGCAEGYSETLFSTDCRPNDQCNDFWFWPAAVLYAVAVALYFVTKPPIVPYLVSHIFWFRKVKAKSEEQNGAKESENSEKTNGCNEKISSSDPGCLKVIFYFYQVVQVLLIATTTGQTITVHFIAPLLSLFNFQIRSSTQGFGCPFPGLTIPLKELLTLIEVLFLVLCIFLLYGVRQIWAKVRGLAHPTLASHMAAATEVILLAYASLATSTFKLLTIIRISPQNELRMFFDGNIVFFHWWHFVLLACVAIYVVPFVGLLFWGAVWLNKNRITAREFLIACVVPLPALIYWAIWRRKRSSSKHGGLQELEERAAVTEVLHGPFRAPNAEEKGALYWESVLIGRRLTLIFIFAFVQMASLRLLLSTIFCTLFTVHHLICNPYKDRKVNIMETVSLLTLVLIGLFNTVLATLVTAGIRVWGPIGTYLDALEWIQACVLLLLPLALVIAVILALVSQVVRAVFVTCAFVRHLMIGVKRRKSPTIISHSKSIRDGTGDSLFGDAEIIDNPSCAECTCQMGLASLSCSNGGHKDD